MSADGTPFVPRVANARMYALDEHVAALWKQLFAWVAAHAGVPLDAVDHAPPRPLPLLWSRDDLGCAFICGYPWSTWQDAGVARPRLLAAPLPSPARYEGRAVYCTDIVVRADSPTADVEALRGVRFAYTAEHSQSGYQAPRALFAARAMRVAGGRFFGDVVGPLQTPRAVVAAVLQNRADAGPLDSWWHDLLRRHDPGTAARLRTIARTPMTAIPPLVAAASVPESLCERLTATLEAVGAEAALRDLRAGLLIGGFARAAPDRYAALAESAQRVDATGYLRLQ
jgi:ABC-type phosphate/phosphonate transport system substrate-binding protein